MNWYVVAWIRNIWIEKPRCWTSVNVQKISKKVLFRWFFFLPSLKHLSLKQQHKKRWQKADIEILKHTQAHNAEIRILLFFFLLYTLCPMKMFSKKENFTFLSAFVNRYIQQKTPFLQPKKTQRFLNGIFFIFFRFQILWIVKNRKFASPK